MKTINHNISNKLSKLTLFVSVIIAMSYFLKCTDKTNTVTPQFQGNANFIDTFTFHKGDTLKADYAITEDVISNENWNPSPAAECDMEIAEDVYKHCTPITPQFEAEDSLLYAEIIGVTTPFKVGQTVTIISIDTIQGLTIIQAQ